MQQTASLNDLDSKNARISKRNTSSTNSRATANGSSYKEVLRNELSGNASQRRQSNKNNSNQNNSANSRAVLDSSAHISPLPDKIINLPLGSFNPSETTSTNEISVILSSDITIPFSGPGGSYTDFIKNNNLSVKQDEDNVLIGDVNDDGNVNQKDVDALGKYMVKLSTDINIKNADINQNGEIGIDDVSDMAALLNKVNEKENSVQTMQGDVNGDGKIDNRDYKSLQSYIDGSYSEEDFIRKNSDLDGDGKITDKDLNSLNDLLKVKNIPNVEPVIPAEEIVEVQPDTDETTETIKPQPDTVTPDDASEIIEELLVVNPDKTIEIVEPVDDDKIFPVTDKTLKYDFNNDGVIDEQDKEILQDKMLIIKECRLYSDETCKNYVTQLENVILVPEILEENDKLCCVKLKMWGDSEPKNYWFFKPALITEDTYDKSQFVDSIIENDLIGKVVGIDPCNGLQHSCEDQLSVFNSKVWYATYDVYFDTNRVGDVFRISFKHGIDGKSQVKFPNDLDKGIWIENIDGNFARIENGNGLTVSYDDKNACLSVDESSSDLDISLWGKHGILKVENMGGNKISIPLNSHYTIKGSGGDDTFSIGYGLNSETKITGNGGHNVFNISNHNLGFKVTKCFTIEDFDGNKDTLNFKNFDGFLSTQLNPDGSMTVRFGDSEVVKIQGKNLDKVQQVVDAHNEKVNPTPTYQEWPATALREVEAYADSSLTTKINLNEKVFVGAPVIILDETENAYKIRYSVGTYPNYTDEKEGWVSKDILQPIEQFETVINPSITEVVTESERIFQVTPGYKKDGYNVVGGGLYIYNLKVDDDPNAEVPITFDLHNTVNATGFIEFYDEDGKFIEAKRINPHSHNITSITKWFEEAGKLINNIKENGIWESPITDPYNSTHEPIEAPKGTHTIVVTNNQNASTYAKISEFVDNWFKALEITKNIASIANSLQKETLNQILIVPAKEKIISEIMSRLRNITKEDVWKFGDSLADSVLKKLSKEELQNLPNQIVQGIDIKKIMSDILKDLEKNGQKIAFELAGSTITTFVDKILGNSNPATIGLKVIGLFGKLIDDFFNDITEKKLEKVKPMIFQIED